MRRALLVLTPLLVSGCILDLGKCNYEHRSLIMTGRLTGAGQPAGEPPIAAELSLNETRGSGTDYRILGITLSAASAGTIDSVTVVDDAPGGPTILGTFTQGNITQPGYWYSDLGDLTPAPHHSQVESSVVRGDLRLIAHFANGSTAEGTMRVASDGDWEHPNCS